MGTWAEGILDNDGAFDGLGDLQQHLVDRLIALGEEMPSDEATGALAAVVGMLLQLSEGSFLDDGDLDEVQTALRAHQPFEGLSAEAAKLLERVLAGEGHALASRPAELGAKVIDLLHSEAGSKSPFGAREAALFEGEAAADEVQDVVDWCVDQLASDFEEDDVVSDLAREGEYVGLLGALLVLEPASLPDEDFVAWRTAAKEGLAVIEESADEVDFHRQYYQRLDTVFGLLLERAAR
jgi:hypothetical protein